MAKSSKQYKVRCSSLPARSHPVAIKIEAELNKLKSWEISSSSSSAKAEKLLSAVSGLEELYKCIGDLFNLPLTQEALSQYRHENWVNELLDIMLKYLDICSNTRDVVLMIKESVRELQSALRRSKIGELSIESNVDAYICSRKKMKKEISKCLASLKQMDQEVIESSPISELNDNLLLVIRLLKKTSLISNIIFSSLLSFLSAGMKKPRATRWSAVWKLVKKKVATFEDQGEANELENADNVISNLLNKEDEAAEMKIESAREKLEALDLSIEGFENGLDCLFRRLIHARVSLMNILSQ
ncbi:DUF241 domain protein [Melia azedarach]|uniref:DUF241 domain protein n=1 Tax=Melia azedarach TaxID=155640 RepID=A0ACC1XSD5_MELAZ|nr:DUF241 domain protein [Melia azedarach]